jgi:hypothetical protein
MSTALIDVGFEYLNGKTVNIVEDNKELWNDLVANGYYFSIEEARGEEAEEEYGNLDLEDSDGCCYTVEADGEQLLVLAANNNGHGDLMVIRKIQL